MMKNNYMLALPLLIFISAAAIFLISKPEINDPLDASNCNCSGPKASKLNQDTD